MCRRCLDTVFTVWLASRFGLAWPLATDRELLNNSHSESCYLRNVSIFGGSGAALKSFDSALMHVVFHFSCCTHQKYTAIFKDWLKFWNGVLYATVPSKGVQNPLPKPESESNRNRNSDWVGQQKDRCWIFRVGAQVCVKNLDHADM